MPFDPSTTLAVIQLGATVVSGCLSGYKLFTQAKTLGKDSQALIWKLRIQETRLRMWAKEWGFVDGVPTSPMALARAQADNDQVLETLLRISDLLTDYKELKRRYGLSLVMDDPDYRPATNYNTVEELITSEFEDYHRHNKELTQQRSRAVGFLKKFRWAVTDRGKLAAITSDLKDLNDGLYHLLSYAERKGLQQGLGHEIETSENPNELEDLEQAAAGCENVPQIVSLKKQRVKMEASATMSSTWNLKFVPTEELQIPIASLTFQETRTAGQVQQARFRATCRGLQGAVTQGSEQVLVEWKPVNKDVSNAARFTQLSRIDGLARLLHISSKPSGLCVPLCMGYIQEEWEARIGLVFKLPQRLQHLESFQSLSLHESLSSREVPYLGDRFRLAFELSNSLSILHKGGWLHKGIRSHNVLFFLGQTGSSSLVSSNDSTLQLEEPYIVGFDYARPDNPNVHSSAVVTTDAELNYYRHPKAQGPTRERFCRAYDVYSLGIVLVEIGFWRRIAEFWRNGYTPESFRRSLCDFYVPKLGSKMGRLYMDVVARCLEGKLVDGEDDVDKSGLQSEENAFYWNIVRELSRLVA